MRFKLDTSAQCAIAYCRPINYALRLLPNNNTFLGALQPIIPSSNTV